MENKIITSSMAREGNPDPAVLVSSRMFYLMCYYPPKIRCRPSEARLGTKCAGSWHCSIRAAYILLYSIKPSWPACAHLLNYHRFHYIPRDQCFTRVFQNFLNGATTGSLLELKPGNFRLQTHVLTHYTSSHCPPGPGISCPSTVN